MFRRQLHMRDTVLNTQPFWCSKPRFCQEGTSSSGLVLNLLKPFPEGVGTRHTTAWNLAQRLTSELIHNTRDQSK